MFFIPGNISDHPADLKMLIVLLNDFCNDGGHKGANVRESDTLPCLTGMVTSVKIDLQVASMYRGVNSFLNISFNSFCSSPLVCCWARMEQL